MIKKKRDRTLFSNNRVCHMTRTMFTKLEETRQKWCLEEVFTENNVKLIISLDRDLA